MHPSSSPCSAPPPTSIHSALHVYQSGCRAQEKPFRGQKSHLSKYPPQSSLSALENEVPHMVFLKNIPPRSINVLITTQAHRLTSDILHAQFSSDKKSLEFSLSSQLKNPFMTKTAAPLKVLCLQTFVHYTEIIHLFLNETKLKRRPS